MAASELRGADAHPGELGCVTGRFQPPHESHLELLQLALSRHDTLAVGVTNPDPTARPRDDANPDRDLPSSNPFTYFERVLLLRALMRAQRVEPNRFIIVPFPLGSGITCLEYVPNAAVQYVRVYSEWEQRKAELLRDCGYPVHVIEPGTPKDRSGGMIREMMEAGGNWQEMVLEPTIELLELFLSQRPIQERRGS